MTAPARSVQMEFFGKLEGFAKDYISVWTAIQQAGFLDDPIPEHIDHAMRLFHLLGDGIMEVLPEIDSFEQRAGLANIASRAAWRKAEAELAEAEAACESGPGDPPSEVWKRHQRALVDLCELEPSSVAQAVRQMEVALVGGDLNGVDVQAIVDRAKRMAGEPA